MLLRITLKPKVFAWAILRSEKGCGIKFDKNDPLPIWTKIPGLSNLNVTVVVSCL